MLGPISKGVIYFKGGEFTISRVYELSNKKSFEVEEELRSQELGVLTNYMGILTNCYCKLII